MNLKDQPGVRATFPAQGAEIHAGDKMSLGQH